MMRRVGARRAAAVLAVVALAAASCSSKDKGASSDGGGSEPTVTAPAARPIDPGDRAALTSALDAAPGCDVIDPTRCLLPFPSDVFTIPGQQTATGRLVNLPTGQLANTEGVALDPTEWNRNDGFSPGTPMYVRLPGVDLGRSAAASIGDIGASVTPASRTVVLDMTDGTRLPHWAELDAAATSPDQQLTAVHPAKGLPEGHRIAVAFVNMVSADGTPVAPTVGFRAYRDNLSTDDPRIEQRRPAMEEVFTALARAGVERSSLTVAWDFTVASAENLAGRLLSMRDTAFAALGDAAPSFRVTETITDPARLRPGIARLVRGTFDVPSFLTGDGGPGSRMALGRSTRPVTNGTVVTQPFSCQVPAAALSGAGGSTRPVVYGHGLLGSHDEVEGSSSAKIAATNNMLYCATDWLGFSESDLLVAAGALRDISRFPAVADRSQQGILGQLFLARLMKSPKGLGTDPAFRTPAGASVIDGREVYYDGNSQGGIMGGAATAVSTEWTKAVLGVPGMNYSILLSRSTDFAIYFRLLTAAYPERIDQMLIYGVLQMLWDRLESNGYAQHMTDKPYPGTPEHTVLLQVAFGDHQVANVTAEALARTIGARMRRPALAEGRHPDQRPFYGFEAPDSFPYDGSLIEYWDSGTLPPPPANITPVDTDQWRQTCGPLGAAGAKRDPRCADPHEDPRRQPGTIAQKDAFFRPDGRIVDPCQGRPCVATPSFQLDY